MTAAEHIDFDAFPPLSLERLDAAVRRLPADRRAQVRWSRPAVERELDRLLAKPITRDRVQATTVTVMSRLVEVVRVFEPETVLEAIRDGVAAWVGMSDGLDDALPPELVDLAAFAVGVICECADFSRVLFSQARDAGVALDDLAPPADAIQAVAATDHGGVWRAQVLMYALERALDRGDVARGRLAEVVCHAHLAADLAVDRFLADGVDLNPMRHLAPGERGAIALRALKALRASDEGRALLEQIRRQHDRR